MNRPSATSWCRSWCIALSKAAPAGAGCCCCCFCCCGSAWLSPLPPAAPACSTASGTVGAMLPAALQLHVSGGKGPPGLATGQASARLHKPGRLRDSAASARGPPGAGRARRAQRASAHLLWCSQRQATQHVVCSLAVERSKHVRGITAQEGLQHKVAARVLVHKLGHIIRLPVDCERLHIAPRCWSHRKEGGGC